jgi:hypothetical protein
MTETQRLRNADVYLNRSAFAVINWTKISPHNQPEPEVNVSETCFVSLTGHSDGDAGLRNADVFVSCDAFMASN